MQNVNYHTHTYRCGHADMDYFEEDYIKDYINAGFKKIAFTDHVPYEVGLETRKNVRMNYSEKDEYLNKIDELKIKYQDKIEIQKGFEVEYSDFHKDYLLKLKKDVDKIILGQHYIVKDNSEVKIFKVDTVCDDSDVMDYYKTIEKAVKIGLPNIIAHPDFYLKSRKEFNKTDEKVANLIGSLSEKYDIPLELNVHNIFCNTYYKDRIPNEDSFEKQLERTSKVIYPNKKFWSILSNYKIRVLFGIDVHYKREISHFKDTSKLASYILGEETMKKLNFVEDI